MKKNIYLILAAVALLASCQKNEEQIGSGRVAPRFTQAAITRATGTTWEAGDAIGIYMVETGAGGDLTDDKIVDGARNIRHTVAAAGATAAFSPADKAETIYFPADGQAVDFFAYCPHQADIVNAIYKIDLSNQANPAAIDLLTARVENKSESTPNVSFAFKHRLTKLSFTLTAGTGLTAADLAGMTVTFKGLPSVGYYDLSAEKLSAYSNIAPIIAKTNPAGTASEAIVLSGLAFQVGNVELAFRLADGTEMEWMLSNPNPNPTPGLPALLVPGKDYRYTLRINAKGTGTGTAVALVSQNVADWTDGNGPNGEQGIVDNILTTTYAVGDYYPDPDVTFSEPGVVKSGKAPIGIVCWLNEQAPGYVAADATAGTPARGLEGCIMSLDESYFSWGPTGTPTGATDENNGLNNMAIIKAIPGWELLYQPFVWCDRRTAGGRTWYLPAFREIVPLYLIYRKDNATVNNKLTAAGGTAITYGGYWSSSEVKTKDDANGNTAHFIDFRYGGIWGVAKVINYGVRAVAAFPAR